jgi:hypothetical protein
MVSRQQARQMTRLSGQIRLATSGLVIVTADLRIRVHPGPRGIPDACEMWGLAGQVPKQTRLCTLPAGVGLRRQLVEEAVLIARLTFPRTGPRQRARWHRSPPPSGSDKNDSPWLDLELTLPGQTIGGTRQRHMAARADVGRRRFD